MEKDLERIQQALKAWGHRGQARPPWAVQPGPGQESVWDYPRPPRLEAVQAQIRVEFGGITLADTVRAMRVCETASPPTYYLPPEDVATDYLRPTSGRSLCEWKGRAHYYDVEVNGRRAPRAVWFYADPLPGFEPIAGYLGFMAGAMDACTVGGERVTPQPGGFYGGWITSDLVGPFKGEPGTGHW